MKALMSRTSSFLEWLGRYVGLVLFGVFFVTAMIIRTTMMTGYFEWAEISSVPWYVYVSGGIILLLTLLWPKLFEFWARSDFSDEFCWTRRCRYRL